MYAIDPADNSLTLLANFRNSADDHFADGIGFIGEYIMVRARTASISDGYFRIPRGGGELEPINGYRDLERRPVDVRGGVCVLDTLFFTALDTNQVERLFQLADPDGYPEVVPGTEHLRQIGRPVARGNFVYFAADDNKTGVEPWRLDVGQPKPVLTSVRNPERELAKAAFTIYPQPASDFLTIRSEVAGQTIRQINFFDLTGRRLGEQQFDNDSKARVTLDGLPHGNFVIQVTTGDGVSFGRIISRR